MALPPMDPQLRKNLLLGGAVAALAWYAGNQYLVAPRAAEAETLATRVEELVRRNSAARGLAQGAGGDPEATLAAYRRQLESVEGLIPSGEELPDLLDAISAEASRSGVELTLIEPTDATEEVYYTRRVYDMAVLGRYHDIGEFLTRVASLPRIVTPRDLTIEPAAAAANAPAGAPVRLEARFSIETYVIPSEPTENTPAPDAP